jgi:hypothetical protein
MKITTWEVLRNGQIVPTKTEDLGIERIVDAARQRLIANETPCPKCGANWGLIARCATEDCPSTEARLALFNELTARPEAEPSDGTIYAAHSKRQISDEENAIFDEALSKVGRVIHEGEIVLTKTEDLRMTSRPSEECVSCSEGLPGKECPGSRRECGHHCNCLWSQDQCCWCSAHVDEDGAVVQHEGEPSAEAMSAATIYLDSITGHDHPEKHAAAHFEAYAARKVAEALERSGAALEATLEMLDEEKAKTAILRHALDQISTEVRTAERERCLNAAVWAIRDVGLPTDDPAKNLRRREIVAQAVSTAIGNLT